MLVKKVIRDILKNKSQFFTIFIMIFLAVFAYAGINAYMNGMTHSAAKYYENQNLQDIWLTSKGFTIDDLNKIKEIENVGDVERILQLKGTVTNPEKYTDPNSNKPLKDLILECNFIEENDLSKMYLVEGEEYSYDKNGLWLDYYLADALNIKTGDEIEFSLEGITLKEKVMGLIETPDHVYIMKDETAIFPTHTDYGYCYMSLNEFPSPYKIMPIAYVDVKDESKVQETINQIKEKIPGIITASTRDDDVSYSGYQREAEEGETYSGIFSGLFVFIAILSVVTTMNRFVRKERTQIGTLKALGFKKHKVTFMYVNYGFLLSVVASILGIILGNQIIGKFFLKMEMEFYEIPYYSIVTIPKVYYVAIGIVILITLITYLSCRKILKEPAAEALRVERPKVKVKEKNITTSSIFKNASLSTKWNIRDILRSKGRTLMALIGITGCTALVIVALGMFDSIKAYMDWEFDIINNFDYKLTLSEDYSDEEFQDLIEKYGNNTSQSVGVEFKHNDQIVLKPLTINNAKGLLQVTDHNKKPFEMKENGIYITEKMAKIYNLKVGDKITWRIINTDTWYESEIVGLNRDPQSQQIFCTKEYTDSLNIAYKPDGIYTNYDLSNVKELPGVSTIQTIGNLKDSVNNMLNMMYALIFMLIIVSVILAFVIIYNLGVLSFSEKEYQFATLKVLGFKDKQIKKIFITQNIWISIVAILISMPLGFILTDYIFKNAIGDTYDFSASIKPITFILSAIGTYIVSLLINMLLSRKVRKIDMVSSLKGNE